MAPWIRAALRRGAGRYGALRSVAKRGVALRGVVERGKAWRDAWRRLIPQRNIAVPGDGPRLARLRCQDVAGRSATGGGRSLATQGPRVGRPRGRQGRPPASGSHPPEKAAPIPGRLRLGSCRLPDFPRTAALGRGTSPVPASIGPGWSSPILRDGPADWPSPLEGGRRFRAGRLVSASAGSALPESLRACRLGLLQQPGLRAPEPGAKPVLGHAWTRPGASLGFREYSRCRPPIKPGTAFGRPPPRWNSPGISGRRHHGLAQGTLRHSAPVSDARKGVGHVEIGPTARIPGR